MKVDSDMLDAAVGESEHNPDPDRRACPKCGSPLGRRAAEGLCLKCLLQHTFPDQARPEVGEDFGEYLIHRRLGQGGMGSVYEAEHRESGRRVALKVIRRELPSEADRARFLREGQLAASVNHPNLVYVYGSDEIEGHGVILMELVPGGTLHDRLKSQGPFAVSHAADIILQIIDGLQALHSVGLLHRDLKPANCFVGEDGSVKIGDFGLSTRIGGMDLPGATVIPGLHSLSESTAGALVDTAPGKPLGTQAYASPEQWRGDPDLDVRTDIFAVGAILFELIVGRRAERKGTAITLIPKTVPPPLARVLERCMAFDRPDRFESCASLRSALIPFLEVDRPPAGLAPRLMAGAIDIILGFVALQMITRESLNPPQWLLANIHRESGSIGSLTVAALLILAWATFERLTECTPGKWLLGLRTTSALGQPPSFIALITRSVVFFAPVILLPMVVLPREFTAQYRGEGRLGPVYAVLGIFLATLAALHSTMRKGNGYAAIQDLLSGTRVRKTGKARRPRTEATRAPARPPSTRADAPRIGPYRLVGPLWENANESLWEGFDDVLFRTVWIHRIFPPTPMVPERRRTIGRPGRPRWLSGRRASGDAWDAFEAFDGEPFLACRSSPRPWAVVRHWVHDLAVEYRAGLIAGDLPAVVDESRIWLARGGRILLVDFPAPNAVTGLSSGAAQAATPPSLEAMQAFLGRVIEISLDVSGGPLGRSIQELRRRLRKGSFPSADALVEALGSLLERAPALSRRRRLVSLLAVPSTLAVVGWLFAAATVIGDRNTNDGLKEVSPAAPTLRDLLEGRKLIDPNLGQQQGSDVNRLRGLVDLRLAGEFNSWIGREDFWKRIPDGQTATFRSYVTAAVAEFPDPSDSELARASQETGEFVSYFAYDTGLFHRAGPWFSTRAFWQAAQPIYLGLIVALLVEFIWILIRGESFLLARFGIAVVSASGSSASRFQLLVRAGLGAATVVLLILVSAHLLSFPVPSGDPNDISAHAVDRVLAGLLAAVLLLCLYPYSRSPQDRIARTYLVLD
ncbi:MAG: protein kinase [Limisphaerales bacterium]